MKKNHTIRELPEVGKYVLEERQAIFFEYLKKEYEKNKNLFIYFAKNRLVLYINSIILEEKGIQTSVCKSAFFNWCDKFKNNDHLSLYPYMIISFYYNKLLKSEVKTLDYIYFDQDDKKYILERKKIAEKEQESEENDMNLQVAGINIQVTDAEVAERLKKIQNINKIYNDDSSNR